MENLIEPLRAIQRDIYPVIQEIEKEMAARAKTTAQAYVAYRQKVIAVGVAAAWLFSVILTALADWAHKPCP